MANRETKFDPERAKSILADLATGNTRACAAARAGVTDRTLRRWLARGKQGKKPFVSFVSALKKAERDAEAFAVRSIVAAGKKNWTAHAWWLERKFPEDWATNRAEVRVLRKEVAAVMTQLGDMRSEPNADGDTTKVSQAAAGEVASIIDRDGGDPEVRVRRELVAEFERVLRGTLKGLEKAVAEKGVAPSTPMSTGWAEPTIGGLIEFFRGEVAALDRFDREDVGTAVLIDIWFRSYSTFRDDLIEGSGQTEWPCPTAWLELQLYRLAWKGPERVSDHVEYNRLNGLLWERTDYVDPVR